MHQEGYSKSGRNIIRNGHISGREAITSGEASPTGRHKKKDPYGSFCHIAATLSTASYTPPHAVFYTSAEQAGTKRKFHTQRAHFRSQTRRPSPITLRIRALPEGSPPHGSLHPRGNECRSDGQRQNAHRRYRSDRPRCGHRRSWLSGGRWQGRGPCPSSCCHRVSRNG